MREREKVANFINLHVNDCVMVAANSGKYFIYSKKLFSKNYITEIHFMSDNSEIIFHSSAIYYDPETEWVVSVD